MNRTHRPPGARVHAGVSLRVCARARVHVYPCAAPIPSDFEKRSAIDGHILRGEGERGRTLGIAVKAFSPTSAICMLDAEDKMYRVENEKSWKYWMARWSPTARRNEFPGNRSRRSSVPPPSRYAGISFGRRATFKNHEDADLERGIKEKKRTREGREN